MSHVNLCLYCLRLDIRDTGRLPLEFFSRLLYFRSSHEISIQQYRMTSSSVTLTQENIVKGFHALADPIRMHILDHLRQHELCVAELCEALDITQSKLSFHLKVLKDADLVYTRHEGRWIYYSLNLAQFIHLEEFIADYRRHSSIFPPPHPEG